MFKVDTTIKTDGRNSRKRIIRNYRKEERKIDYVSQESPYGSIV
jgi:hypothetical protein